MAETMSTKEFIAKYDNFIKDIAKADCKPEYFNIFNILGLQNYEIRHSNYMVWLLKNNRFFKSFIKECQLKERCNLDSFADCDLDSDRVIDTEESFNEIDDRGHLILRTKISDKNTVYIVDGRIFARTIYDGKEADDGIYKELSDDDELKRLYDDLEEEKRKKSVVPRKIDINIIAENYTLTIENKVDSIEHDNQCKAYKNYMDNCEKYAGKKHYYVFLAKSLPPDFDKNLTYEGYSFIDYETVKRILEDMTINSPEWKTDSNEYSTVRQYIQVLNEWTSFPERYRELLNSDTFDMEPFAEENYQKQFDKKFMEKLSNAQRSFVEIARKYYLSVKNEMDSMIEPALRKISKDSLFIKENYARGNYAKAIPASFEDIGNKERQAEYLARRQQRDHSAITLDDVAKEKDTGGLKKFFKSVDYRAPRGGFKRPSIAIVSGLNAVYADNLSADLSSNKSNVLNEIIALVAKGWRVKFEYSMKDGGKVHQAGSLVCNETIIKDLSYENRKELFKTKIFQKTKKAYEIVDGALINYLDCFSKFGMFTIEDVKAFKNLIYNYYFGFDPDTIDNNIKLIESFFSDEKYSHCADEYKEWKKENKVDSLDYASFNKNVGNEEDKHKIIEKVCEIACFREWLLGHLPSGDKDNPKSLKNIKKLPKFELQDWIIENVNCFDQRNRIEAFFNWNVTIFYELKEAEFKDEDVLMKTLKEKTLEGVATFGYSDWFKKVIFN